jgi:hypothetical protein
MDEIKITLIFVVVFAILVWLLHKINEIEKKNIYVHPKTKNKYLVKGIVKMKDTLSLEWVDAVLYTSLKTGNYYVRNKKQFYDKFIILKEWEENGGNDKSSRGK